MFQACLNAAACKREVIFICPEQFQYLPLFVHNMTVPDADILKIIKFKLIFFDGFL